MKQRNCNALESIFAGAKITAGVCVAFDTPINANVVEKAIKMCLKTNICGYTEILGMDTDTAHILSLRNDINTDISHVNSYPVDLNMPDVFQKLLSTSDAFSQNTIDAVIILEPTGTCRGVCFNGNHCLWDGKSIIGIIESFVSFLNKRIEEKNDFKLFTPSKICYEWGQMLKDTVHIPNIALPTFLPSFKASDKIVTMKAIQNSFNESNEGQKIHQQKNENGLAYEVCDIRVDIEAEIVEKVLKLLRKKQCGTLTGLLITCIQQAFSEIYLKSQCLSNSSNEKDISSCNITTSVLVNLRKSLGSDLENDKHVSQCFGNVIVGNTMKLLNGYNITDILLEKCNSTTLDLKNRIKRGEAVAHSLILSKGNFHEGDKDHATFELSNFGIYNIDENISIHHTQRFEGHDGVSVLTHSEKNKGVLRLAASLMGPINPLMITSVFQRIKTLFRLLSKELDDEVNKKNYKHHNNNKKQIVWITAWSGVGKTTTGDYLSKYHGWHHLDGDDDFRKLDVPEVKKAVDGVGKAFNEFWFKGKSAPNELWHPFHIRLVNRCLDASKEHDKVVVSFAVYNRQVRDFLRDHFCTEISLLFLHLDCNVDVVVKGALARVEEYLKMPNVNKSIDEWWNSSEAMVGKFEGECFQEMYGEYSYDNFKRMQFDKFLSGMQPLEDDEEGLILDVSARDNSVFQDISNILGLPYEIKEGGIDMAALKAVQKARWEEE